MDNRRAGGIVAAVTLTIAAAFVAIAFLIIHTSVESTVDEVERAAALYADEVSLELRAYAYAIDPERVEQGATLSDIMETEQLQSATDLAESTIDETILAIWEDDHPDAVVFNELGIVLLSTADGVAVGESVWERYPQVGEELLALLEGGEPELVWIGLEGLLPRGQELIMLVPTEVAGGYLLVLSDGESYFGPMRTNVTTLVLALGVVMILLLLLVMLIVRWYRARLMKAATTDELTGLANRKWFSSSYQALQESGMGEAYLTLIDVDKFKQINDSYGHASGDKALAFVAQAVRETVAGDGIAGRWGGDEFIAVMRLPQEEAISRAKRLIEQVAAEPVEGVIPVSISVGLAAIGEGEALERAAEHADDALYVTKEGGRGFLTTYVKGVTPHIGDEAESTDALSEKAERDLPTQGKETSSGAARSVKDVEVRSMVGMRLSVRLVLTSLLDAVYKMVPFVAGGGILIALAFLIDGASVDLGSLSAEARASFGSITPLAAGLKDVGSAAFNFMLPIFAAFFARGLAGDEAFMAGFAGGFLSSQGSAGFAGAIASAVVAAIVVNLMRGVLNDTGRRLQRVAPVLLYPVFSLLIMYLLMNFLIEPAATAFDGLLTTLLESSAQGSRIALGALAGAMMATDMGGPINKAAYHFGTAAITAGAPDVMAAVMVGGMVPPCGIAICMLLFRDRFSEAEADQGPATLFMGLSFITEGALPFVLTDPVRVIGSSMLGSAVAGALSELFGCTLMAPHGGVFVFPVVEHPVLYAVALALGALVAAVALGVLKHPSQARARAGEREGRR